ncbi:MAG: CoA transferase [Betaproteobacteria bacterium]|nr:CoA transferase [Betaproteobacteria bacterium]
MNVPLEGLRVLDFGQGVAGPYAAQLLGDHGADVIKVEPPRGDWARTMGAQDGSGLSGTFVAVNRNKRGLCLDLGKPAAVDLARDLARRADVVVESFRPGVMDRLGLGCAALQQVNPKLVYCSVTGFGDSGPNVRLPAGDSIMQAYGGLMSIIGERDGGPLRVGNVVSDMLAGANAFGGILLSLFSRTTTGKGGHVRVSLLDSIVAFQAPPLTEFLLTGDPPKRLGNEHPLIAPSGAVRTRDGQINFTVFDHQWRDFCEGLGLAALPDDPRFAGTGERQKNRDALSRELSAVFAKRTSAEWIEALRAIDVLCAPINDYPALVRDPQVLHNALIQTAVNAEGREFPLVRNAVAIDGETQCLSSPPRLGEHTAAILEAELGLGGPEVAKLLADGVARAMPAAPATQP